MMTTREEAGGLLWIVKDGGEKGKHFFDAPEA